MVIYRCAQLSRWGVSRHYDFLIGQAIDLLYEHYVDLPDDLRQHLVCELIKTKKVTINIPQFIEKFLRNEVKYREKQEEIHSKEAVC